MEQEETVLERLYNGAEASISWLLQTEFMDKIKDEVVVETRSLRVSKDIKNATVESKKGWIATTDISGSDVTVKNDIDVFKVNSKFFSGIGVVPYSYGGNVIDSTLKAKNIHVGNDVKGSKLTASKKIQIADTCSNSTLKAPVVEVQDEGYICSSHIETKKLKTTSGIARSTIVLEQKNGQKVAYSTIDRVDGKGFQEKLFPVVLPTKEH
jgi:hypothetical protein